MRGHWKMDETNSTTNYLDNEIKEILKAQTLRCVAAAKIELDRVCLAKSTIGLQILEAIGRCGDFET